MKEKIDLVVIGNQIVDGESHKTEISTVGTYEITENGFKLEYEDYIEGMSSTTSTIEVTGGTQVDIIREGDICTNMSVCAGERHQCHYVTPYGGILLGVNGDEVKVGNGSLYIKYTLDLNPNILSTNEVNIKFSAIKS